MKRFTTTIPTDIEELVLLKNEKIVAAFINALPPRGDDLHGTSVEFFFEGGGSCSIDGLIVDIAPKQEAYLLHFGKAMEMPAWRNRLYAGNENSTIEAIDLHALWSGEGLGALLAGPRDVRFWEKTNDGENFREKSGTFEIMQLHVPGIDPNQNLFLHASQDFPGDVVISLGPPISKLGFYESTWPAA